ncbi:MAG: thioredoxin-like domain-containing protein [Cyclobacteriaceae bacterium]|nr:thioredoxin-like domain-containing protein [Cyclobacteriaceae bacterium]
MKHLLIAFIALMLSQYAQSQSGYRIDFKIKNWKDTTVYLGSYYGENTVLRDTAKSKAGSFHFDGKITLPEGAYYLVLGKNKLFDFVVGKNKFFTIETTANPTDPLKIEDYMKTLVVKNDDDNKLFFDNIHFIAKQSQEAEPLIKILRDSTLNEDQKKDARASFSKINDRVMAFHNELMEKHPTSMTARLLKVTKQIEIPNPPQKADGSIDSTFQLKYYRQHFFDNLDLADEAMIRLPRPFYQEKVKEYLEKLFVQAPDSVIKAINGIVEKAKKNQETYRNMIFNLMVIYQAPEIMGLDEVFVHLNDKYWASGEMNYWAAASIKKSMQDHADKIRISMIGRTGANLIMQDQNLQPRSMYDIKNKYTILFIFDPDCGHCREETPGLVEFYNKSKAQYNFEVYAVSSDTSMLKMKKFVKEFKTPWITVNGPRTYLKEHYSKLYHSETTPTIYILNDKKKIIAKKLSIKSLDDFLSRHEKFEKMKKSQPTKGS